MGNIRWIGVYARDVYASARRNFSASRVRKMARVGTGGSVAIIVV